MTVFFLRDRDGLSDRSFQPIRVQEIELDQPLPRISTVDPASGQHYERVQLVVRLHTRPLGVVYLAGSGHELHPADYAPQIWRELAGQINDHLRLDCLPEIDRLPLDGLASPARPHCLRQRAALLAAAPFVSVVVCTRDRPQSLGACLRSLLLLEYADFEIIVVDNAPSTNATAALVQNSFADCAQVRYVREDRPGLSWARNRGLLAARAEIVAFTDDDVLVDRHWLSELVCAFAGAEDVACVTGPALPAELETPAQTWFEQHGGFCKGFTRRVFNMGQHRPAGRLYPYSAGIFGTGANMAVRASVLRAHGGFDPDLGAGSRSRGGEDLAAYFQVITSGYTLVYEPAAIVYHVHRPDMASLRKQMYSFGVGFTAYLTRALLQDPRRIPTFLISLPYGLLLLLRTRSARYAQRQAFYPRELVYLELTGMLFGPFAYLQQRLARKTGGGS